MTTPEHRPLSPADLEVLEFERTPWKYAGAKDAAILERFGHNVVRYYQRLNHIIDTPAAEAYDPELVRRLRRLRAERQARRGARRTGFEVAQ